MKFLVTVVRIYDNHTIENNFCDSYKESVDLVKDEVDRYTKLFPEVTCNAYNSGRVTGYVTVSEDKTNDRKLVIKLERVSV